MSEGVKNRVETASNWDDVAAGKEAKRSGSERENDERNGGSICFCVECWMEQTMQRFAKLIKNI